MIIFEVGFWSVTVYPFFSVLIPGPVESVLVFNESVEFFQK